MNSHEYLYFNIKYHAHYGEAIVRTMYIMGMTYYQPMREQENSDRDLYTVTTKKTTGFWREIFGSRV